jgi:CHAT domain/FHA domain
MSTHPKLLLRVQPTENEAGSTAVPHLEFILEDERGQVRATATRSPGVWREGTEALEDLSAHLNELIGKASPSIEQWYRAESALQEIVPAPIHDHLEQDQSYVELQAELSDWPWELSSSLAHQLFVSRVPNQPVRVLSTVTSQERPRALVGSNAHGLSDWANGEAVWVRQVLQENFEVDNISGKELTRKGLIEVLSEGDYAVVHLICYLTPEGIVLSDGVLTNKELRRLNGSLRPRMVVLHAITQGPTRILRTAHETARTLMGIGIPTVLVTGWNPDPKAARNLAVKLYQTPEDPEQALWETLREAREAAREWEDTLHSWAAYFAYGDWRIRLSELKPVKIETVQNAPTSRGGWQADYQLVVLEGPDKGAELPLFAAALDNGRKITIGRPGPFPVDLSFDDDALDNVTASLEKAENLLVLTNRTGQPEKVRVNGLPVSSTVVLKGCDEIWFGATRLRIEPVTAGGASEPIPLPEKERYELVVISGVERDRSATLKLLARVTLVGRLNDCGLMLHDPSVSRHHLTLVPKDSGYFASGIGDAPVVINGFPINQEHRLKHDDTLQLSPATVLKFRDAKRKN